MRTSRRLLEGYHDMRYRLAARRDRQRPGDALSMLSAEEYGSIMGKLAKLRGRFQNGYV